MLEHKGYSVNFWDIGGQKIIWAYWQNHFEQTDGLLWVVDSSDRLQLEMCRDKLFRLLQQEKLANASLLIFANKQDIKLALSCEEIASMLDLDANDQYKNQHWSIQS